MSVTLRLAQHDCTLANFDKNLQKHVAYIEQAIRDGIEFIAFPELSLAGYNLQDAAQDIAVHIHDPSLQPLRDLSNHISILCGAVELSDDYGVYNSAFFFEDGNGTSVHRKIYLPTYGMFEELRYFSAGIEAKPFVSRRLGSAGVAICEDNWHLGVPYLLAAQGAKVIFSMSNSPLRIDFASGELKIAEGWSMMSRTYAMLLSVYVAFINRTGNEDGLSYWGGSELISPDGAVICKAPCFEETALDAVIDFNLVKRARLRSSHFLDDDPRWLNSELERVLKQRR
jgi:predicted amidohydrolase